MIKIKNMAKTFLFWNLYYLHTLIIVQKLYSSAVQTRFVK